MRFAHPPLQKSWKWIQIRPLMYGGVGEWCSGGTHCDWSFSSLRFYNFTLICSGMSDSSLEISLSLGLICVGGLWLSRPSGCGLCWGSTLWRSRALSSAPRLSGGRYRWAFAPVCDPLYVVKYQCRLNTSIQSEANTNGCNTQVIFIYFFLYCGVFLRVWLKIKLLIIKEITQV